MWAPVQIATSRGSTRETVAPLYTKTSREAAKNAKTKRYMLATLLRGFASFA